MGIKVSTFTPIIQVTESHENDPDHPQWLKDIEAEYFEYSRKSPYADRIRMLIEMFATALDKAGTDNPTDVGFALEGLTGRGAKGETFMREIDHQIHFDMVISHVSENVDKPFIYNDENYGMAYITDGWVSRADITLPTTCKMKRPKKS